MSEELYRRIRELEQKVGRLEERQEKDFSKLFGLTFSLIRPLIAVAGAGLQTGVISTDAAIANVSDKSEGSAVDKREEESDRRTIQSWAGMTKDDE